MPIKVNDIEGLVFLSKINLSLLLSSSLTIPSFSSGYLIFYREMGYDIARFQGEVDEELICPICSSVLEEPLHAPNVNMHFVKVASMNGFQDSLLVL
ncbi:hypothetical protein CEXT_82801 [Caerostris extrusa]|uniref:Uncharacterized protein n=1 Tax=Caerostris extrusa TaxID=172846 RepID=A0AAV4MCI2_CAEEX|nr:hypothetical protein CEXT_82801 [Caerostris extrusa]